MANTKITTNVIADDAVTSDKLGGDLTMPGHVSLADNKELRIGTGNDLVIKHDATDTIFTNTTGNLVLAGSHVYIANAANNEYMGLFIADGAASLRFNNIEELATISGGVYFPNRIGIGTNSPASFYTHAQNLVVGSGSGGEGLTIYSGSSDSGYIGFNDTASNGMQGFIQYNHDGDYMAFAPNGTEKVRITSAGNVGIGTTTPTSPLHIASATNRTLLLDYTAGSGGYTWASFKQSGTEKFRIFGDYTAGYLSFYNETQSAHQLTLESSGKVGIGTTSPGQKLTVAGAVESTSAQGNVAFYATTAGSYNQQNGSGGTAWAYGATGGSSSPATAASTTFGMHHWNGSAWSNPVNIDTSGRVTKPLQPVAIYHYTNSNQDGAYGYSWPGTGTQSVTMKPQGATLNRGSMYDTSNGRFTAPVAGIYRYAIHGNLYTNNLNATAYYLIQAVKNTTHYLYFYEANSINNANGWVYVNVSGLVSMAATDYLTFNLKTNNLTTSGVNGFGWDLSQYTHFEFQLLY